MSPIAMTIGGKAVTSAQTVGVINPATGSVFAHCPECSAAQLDAALESAAQAFSSWRQVCIAIKRLYVHERVYQPLVEELATIARTVRLGDGHDPASELGPINNEPQFQRVIELVEDAKGAGGRIVTGGERLNRPGYFFPPTIVTGVAAGTRLVDEEQFGPALPIMPFSRLDEAVAQANATHFGLGASVWTSDVAISPVIPLGGIKWSGIGYQSQRLPAKAGSLHLNPKPEATDWTRLAG